MVQHTWMIKHSAVNQFHLVKPLVTTSQAKRAMYLSPCILTVASMWTTRGDTTPAQNPGSELIRLDECGGIFLVMSLLIAP